MALRRNPGRLRGSDPPGRARRSRSPSRDEGFDDASWGEDDTEERPARRRPLASSRRGPESAARPSRLGRSRGRSKIRFDFGAEDEEDADNLEFDQDFDAEEPGHAHHRREKRRKLSLVNLCTPLFGYAAVLPREAGGVHPGYAAFRQEVTTALQRVEKEAPDHGIDRDDARESAYALSCFLDEQVASSQWTGKNQWGGEPLGIVLHQDPDGGVNFFRRLEGLGDRQKKVKEVFLVCLAFGFRGKYVEFDPTQQIAQLGEIRQRILREIHPTPMDRLPELFPDAYLPAAPIESEGPPAPRWWIWASLGVVVVALVVYVVLLSLAGPPEGTVKRIESLTKVIEPPLTVRS